VQTPALLGECLTAGDPAVRRAAARVLALHPDAALAPALRDAFLKEEEVPVRDALGEALAAQPDELAPLKPAVDAAQRPELSAAFDRAVDGALARRLAGKIREGLVPGFYKGQFSDLWRVDPRAAERLLAFANDDALHHVFRVMAVMALNETRDPALEKELAPLIKGEYDELQNSHDEFFERFVGARDIERFREFDLSRYARFSLAKAGMRGPVVRLIRTIDEFLGTPREQDQIRQDVDPDNREYWEIEWRRMLLFDSGYYFQQFDDYENASKRYTRIVIEFPKSRACENAYYNRACIFAIRGRPKEAIDDLRNAIRHGFTNVDWLLEDGDLKSLRDLPEFKAVVEEARTGVSDESGRNWKTRLQPFLPAGTPSFFSLDAKTQAEVWKAAGARLTPAEKRRMVEEAPLADRERIRALVGEPDGH
jgi:tetratricopeptide (TPR) repeat protein